MGHDFNLEDDEIQPLMFFTLCLHLISHCFFFFLFLLSGVITMAVEKPLLQVIT